VNLRYKIKPPRVRQALAVEPLALLLFQSKGVNSGSSVDNPRIDAQRSYNVSAVPIKFLRNSLSQVTERDNKMSSAVDSMPDASRLYIGEGVTIKGEISVPDTLVVCGSVEGDVSVGNLVVGETGVIKGRIIVAQNAEISGKVFEKLDVKCLMILRSTSRVDGNVSYGMLQIEQGATIAGGISSTEYRPEQKPARSEQPVRQEQKPLQSPIGNGARLGKQPDLSALDAAPSPVQPPVR
jgi:cytoskeletal protein CcmA (bactofilin family)